MSPLRIVRRDQHALVFQNASRHGASVVRGLRPEELSKIPV